MKKIFTLVVTVLLCLFARSETVVIDVVDNQFNPANVNANVGDVIEFNFHASEFNHNATSSGAVIPEGAAPISSGGLSKQARIYNYTISEEGVYNFYCLAHGDPGGTGMAGTITVSGPLPVSLKMFDVAAQADKKPMLRWSTATEQNVAYFSVRSSTDGAHFSEIAKVPAKGNSSHDQVYQFKDNSLSSKFRYVFYELVTTDKDGKQYHSPIKMFKTDFAKSKLVSMLSPNPIKRPGQLMVQFNAENKGVMQVNVFDMNGKRVLKTNLSAFPGLNNGHVHVCDLLPGVYTLQFNYEGIRETKKIIVN